MMSQLLEEIIYMPALPNNTPDYTTLATENNIANVYTSSLH